MVGVVMAVEVAIAVDADDVGMFRIAALWLRQMPFHEARRLSTKALDDKITVPWAEAKEVHLRNGIGSEKSTKGTVDEDQVAGSKHYGY